MYPISTKLTDSQLLLDSAATERRRAAQGGGVVSSQTTSCMRPALAPQGYQKAVSNRERGRSTVGFGAVTAAVRDGERRQYTVSFDAAAERGEERRRAAPTWRELRCAELSKRTETH